MYTDLLAQRKVVADALRVYEGGELGMPYTVAELLYRKVFYTEQAPELSQGAAVYVCGLGYHETCLSRSTKRVDMEIQICLEGRYETEAHAQDYIGVVEAMLSACSEIDAWTENRMSIDEHGMPYQFHILREQSVFQSIWDAVYKVQRRRHLTIEPQGG